MDGPLLARLCFALALADNATERLRKEGAVVNPSVFARAFRREFGHSPRELRSAAWLNGTEAPSLVPRSVYRGAAGAWALL